MNILESNLITISLLLLILVSEKFLEHLVSPCRCFEMVTLRRKMN